VRILSKAIELVLACLMHPMASIISFKMFNIGLLKC